MGRLGQYEAIRGNTKQYEAVQGNTRQHKEVQNRYKTIRGNTRQYKAVQGRAVGAPAKYHTPGHGMAGSGDSKIQGAQGKLFLRAHHHPGRV